jgi:hypothetical protein
MTGDSLHVIQFKFYGSEQQVEKILREMKKLANLVDKETVQITRRCS